MVAVYAPPVIKRLYDIGQHGAVLATAGSDGHIVSGFEESSLGDGVVDFRLEGEEETFLAQRISSLGSLQNGSLATVGAALDRHLAPLSLTLCTRLG